MSTDTASDARGEPAAEATQRLSAPPVWLTYTDDVPRAVAESWLREFPRWFAADGAEDSPNGRDDKGRAGGESGAGDGRDGARAGRAAGLLPGAKVVTLTLETGQSTVKRERPTVGRSVRYALSGRPGRASRAFRLGRALRQAGVSTATPLALIEVRRRGLVRDSVLVMETLEGETLRELLEREALDAAARRALFAAVAREVARLHAAGYRQRDLKAPNVLVARGETGEYRVHLIDLEGVSRMRRLPTRVRVRDLARLWVSLRAMGRGDGRTRPSEEDWQGLIADYLLAAGGCASASEIERFVRETTRWAQSKERRNRRRGRPLA